MKKQAQIILMVIAVLLGLGVGYWIGNDRNSMSSGKSEEVGAATGMFTCSMHPQIQLPDPKAKCPLCGMDLIPVSSGDTSDLGPRELKMSPRATKLAEVYAVPVEKKFVTNEIRMAGKIEYDETRIATITARVPGRLDRLYVDYAGISVTRGDHLVEMYSPELYSAQEELLQAIQTSQDLSQSTSPFVKQQSTANIQSAKEKLAQWGISESQIDAIIQKGKSGYQTTINSPISGIVVEKGAVEGMYVQTGTRVYTIADLTSVWVKLDAYESDISWIHFGQEVEFHTEAYPGEIFKGKVAFIAPVINARTRTVKIRVNVPNPGGRLKPEMFVRAIVKSKIALGGKVMDPGLAGKWISPMHPEIIKDEPGQCDICGMDLVSAESLGYVSADNKDSEAPLVIPVSAPMITGKRAVVYVELEPGHYQGREIELGQRAGDYYIVKSGLEEGEKVVAHGAFKIDSAIQILGKPSMMNPEGGGSDHGHDHGADSRPPAKPVIRKIEATEGIRKSLDAISDSYFKMHHALSRDNHMAAKEEALRTLEILKSGEPLVHKQNDHNQWMQWWNRLTSSITEITASSDIKVARTSYEHFSNSLIEIFQSCGGVEGRDIYIYHCPMAFGGRGADWLQSIEGTENPYYGDAMFKCGTMKSNISQMAPHQHNE